MVWTQEGTAVCTIICIYVYFIYSICTQGLFTTPKV